MPCSNTTALPASGATVVVFVVFVVVVVERALTTAPLPSRRDAKKNVVIKEGSLARHQVPPSPVVEVHQHRPGETTEIASCHVGHGVRKCGSNTLSSAGFVPENVQSQIQTEGWAATRRSRTNDRRRGIITRPILLHNASTAADEGPR